MPGPREEHLARIADRDLLARQLQHHLRLSHAPTALQDLGEVEADRLLQLRVGARARLAVRPPADELGGVPEPRALHVVVADLDHALRAQRDERQVLVRVPPAGHGRPRGPLARLVLRPVPRVRLEGGDQRLQFVEQLLAPRQRERADHAHAGQPAVVGVQAEQQRADAVLAALVDPVTGHHAVRGALVLDLQHHPPVRLVDPPGRLGDQPVQARALELAEPAGGDRPVGGRRGQVDWEEPAVASAPSRAARRSANGRAM